LQNLFFIEYKTICYNKSDSPAFFVKGASNPVTSNKQKNQTKNMIKIIQMTSCLPNIRQNLLHAKIIRNKNQENCYSFVFGNKTAILDMVGI